MRGGELIEAKKTEKNQRQNGKLPKVQPEKIRRQNLISENIGQDREREGKCKKRNRADGRGERGAQTWGAVSIGKIADEGQVIQQKSKNPDRETKRGYRQASSTVSAMNNHIRRR